MDMMKPLKALELITSPFKYLAYRKAAYYIYKKHLTKILSDISYSNLPGSYLPIDLMEERVFRGIMKSLFKPNEYYISVTDLAVAINISTSHYCKNTFNEESHYIIDLSYHIVSELKEKIIENKILAECLKDFNKTVDKIETNSDRQYIERVFKNKKALFIHYFSTFNDSKYNHTIKIWHQGNNNNWINWSEEESIDININTHKIREGFFLVGFDYYDITQNKRLSVASNINGYEYFNKYFDQESIVWLQ